jgi:hypothetical protein
VPDAILVTGLNEWKNKEYTVPTFISKAKKAYKIAKNIS